MNDYLQLLERKDLLTPILVGANGNLNDKSDERLMAIQTVETSLKSLRNYAWKGRRATYAQVKKEVRQKIIAEFGVLQFLLWMWRIYSWVKVIWDTWEDA